MRNLKKFGTLAVAVLALSAISAANGSAATFTSSATGTLSGKALETQVFSFNGGKVECSAAEISGTIVKTADTQWHWTKYFGPCVAFGFASVDITKFTISATPWTLHITASLVFTPTLFGMSMCTVTVNPQTVGGLDFANSGSSNVKVTPTVTGISYTSTGGSCGSSGENGTYTGASELNRVGGGPLRYDA
jgi:hypothetical protein